MLQDSLLMWKLEADVGFVKEALDFICLQFMGVGISHVWPELLTTHLPCGKKSS